MSDKKFGHRYQKVFSRIWEDEKFIELSTGAQLVYLYLITNKNLSIIGFYTLAFRPKKMIGGFKDWPAFQKQMEEVISAGMVKFDEEQDLVLIENFLKYNPIYSVDQLEGAHKVLVDLPRGQLFYDLLDTLENPDISGLGINAKLASIVRNMLGIAVPPVEVGPVLETTEVDGVPPKEVKADAIEWVMHRWNEICGDLLPKISKLSDQRKALIRARISEYSTAKIEEVFHIVVKSPFLIGENKTEWKADFDFVMGKSKFLKILEGSYQGKGSGKSVSKATDDAIRKVAEEWFPKNQLGEEDGPENIPPGYPDGEIEF